MIKDLKAILRDFTKSNAKRPFSKEEYEDFKKELDTIYYEVDEAEDEVEESEPAKEPEEPEAEQPVEEETQEPAEEVPEVDPTAEIKKDLDELKTVVKAIAARIEAQDERLSKFESFGTPAAPENPVEKPKYLSSAEVMRKYGIK